MRRKNAFLSCCLTLCLAVGMTVSVPVSAAAKTSTETQKSYPKYETYYALSRMYHRVSFVRFLMVQQ